MVRLSFQNLSFSEKDGKIRVVFLNYAYFYLEKAELERLGGFSVQRNAIDFRTSRKKENISTKFNFLLSQGFESLRSTLTGKPVLYVHQNSGIPLFGSGEFGIVDRGTNMIEVKPLTLCNINCVFCSVDHDRRGRDIIVEREYLIGELEKVIAIKKGDVNIHIGGQGDPSLYGDLVGLVKDMRRNPRIKTISMVSNGIVLSKTMTQQLIEAGLTHFHVSLCAIDQDMADKMAQTKYPVDKVMELCRQVMSSGKSKVILAPVWVPGWNDTEIDKIIEFGKEIGALVGIQNYLEYQFGKRPVKSPLSLKVFFERIARLEEKHGIDLKGLDGELMIVPDNEMLKAFRKGELVEVDTVWDGRLKNTRIGVARDRVVNVISCSKQGKVKVKIIRTKHNIYVGAPA